MAQAEAEELMDEHNYIKAAVEGAGRAAQLEFEAEGHIIKVDRKAEFWQAKVLRQLDEILAEVKNINAILRESK